MTSLVKWFGMKRARRMFKRAAGDLGGANPVMRRRLINKLASRARDMTRRNITTQGGGKWAKLSKWTQAQTGRRKALITLRKFVTVKKSTRSGLRASVIFRSPGAFTLTQHHDGFTDPAKGDVVKIVLRRPGALGLPPKATSKSFVDRSNRRVPARKVWPEGRALAVMIRVEAAKWRRELDRRLSRR